MKRFFFNFFNGVQWSTDSVGQNMIDLNQVYREARHAIVQLSESYFLVDNRCTIIYKIIDEEGKNVYEIRLSLSEDIFTPTN